MVMVQAPAVTYPISPFLSTAKGKNGSEGDSVNGKFGFRKKRKIIRRYFRELF